MNFLVDSNVILDIVTNDKTWFDWSAQALSSCAEQGILCINPIIYAEVSIGFKRIEELELAIPAQSFKRLGLPLEAAFLAGKVFLLYRKNSGQKSTPLPDFFIGAHAVVGKMTLISRDLSYQSYFPGINLIQPA